MVDRVRVVVNETKECREILNTIFYVYGWHTIFWVKIEVPQSNSTHVAPAAPLDDAISRDIMPFHHFSSKLLRVCSFSHCPQLIFLSLLYRLMIKIELLATCDIWHSLLFAFLYCPLVIILCCFCFNTHFSNCILPHCLCIIHAYSHINVHALWPT